jgi:glycosyltransferase involved in cell wall biosynthesis
MPKQLLIPLSMVFRVRGGIPRFNQMLCLALDQLAPQLDFSATVVSQDDRRQDYEDAGKPWHHLEFVAGNGRRGLMTRTLGQSIRSRPDLMLIGLVGMTPLGVACLPFLRGGFGFIAHGAETWAEPRYSRRFSVRRARFAFAVSRHTGASLQRTFRIPAERIRRLPNTLDPGFGAFDEAVPEESQPPELLTVARLWAEEGMKGVDHTLKALASLSARHPHARYRIVGKGSDKARLQALAASLGLGQRVSFEEDLGDDELAERYRRCAGFVMPSGQEGFGIVFLEAMRFSKPCIGGDAGGTPDVIVDDETGFLVPYGDPGTLADRLDRLLSEPELRRRLGRAGRQRLIDEFTFERFKARVAEYIGELL